MDMIRLPVVAHRLFGRGHTGRGEAWREGVDRLRFIGDPFASLLWDELEEDEGDFLDGTLAYAALGTRRTTGEIRDVIDGVGRAEGTTEFCVNRVWAQAGIEFRLVAIIDESLRSDHASIMPGENLPRYARIFNHPGMVNVYFCRDICCALGQASFSAWPHDDGKQPAYAAAADWESHEHGRWSIFANTLAHELGHLLSLQHDDRTDTIMADMFAGESYTALTAVQIMVARASAKRYLPVIRDFTMTLELFRELYESDSAEPIVKQPSWGEVFRFGKAKKGTR